MASLPHDGTAAMLLNIVVQALGGLHFAQHRAAGTVLQNIAREDHHEAIAPENVPLLVDRADPVGVTVISDSNVRAGFLYGPDGGWGTGRRVRNRGPSPGIRAAPSPVWPRARPRRSRSRSRRGAGRP